MTEKMTSFWSLTEHLLTSAPEAYKAATQSPFLLTAAEGRLPKEALGKWLANDRLYIHSYIKAAGQMLVSLDLPQTVPKLDFEAPETQLVDWIIEALAAVRREERFFIDVASRYDLGINLEGKASAQGLVQSIIIPIENKLPGLVMLEDIFSSVGSSSIGAASVTTLPWLEGAVTFWGTERCYLDAWSWARSRQPLSGTYEAKDDADGGALRKEFIPNWSSAEFASFVAKLGSLIDLSASHAVERLGEGVKRELIRRVEGKWISLLAAEAAFWPKVD